MTIACQSANASPSFPNGVQQPPTDKLSAQNMTITTAVPGPCYDPCTLYVDVTWINDTAADITTPQTVGVQVDTNTPITTTTSGTIAIGSTVGPLRFIVTGLMHNNSNVICPVPN